MRDTVRQAFNAARNGDFGETEKLIRLGDAVVAHLQPYAQDDNYEIRRQTTMLLIGINGPSSLPLLIERLNDSDERIQEKAALGLYEKYAPEDLLSSAMLAPALFDSISHGNTSPAAVLLLSYFPSDAHARLIRQKIAENAQQVKLHNWSKPVSYELPAIVALSQMEGGAARQRLLAYIEANARADIEFLLDTIREIDSPEVLHALAKTLNDKRTTSRGTPSGAVPERRLCDEAVNAYVARLDLAVSFQLTTAGRYDDKQINAVKQHIKQAVPM